jgi:(E)-4-hydroxy-3-methylbut-2-enyl-diphosphate synthase
MPEMRAAIETLITADVDLPVVLKWDYSGLSDSRFQLGSSTDAGALLTDGLGDGIWITSDSQSDQVVNSTVFGLMQASRTRISKTEYISCPSCGRTLFDLQETTAKIRERTDHLIGVKIGIMGCIVNGPGEMADADYGYVGVGVGKITLYKGQEVVKRSIASDLALDELIELIKTHGDWVEPIALEV